MSRALWVLVAVVPWLPVEDAYSQVGTIQSLPISDVSYEVRFDSALASRRLLHVEMAFTTAARGEVVLSLPAWTPGAYEISNFARKVENFSATSGDRGLTWDKLDYDTWRVRVDDPGRTIVSFEFLADTLDNAMAWARPDFAFFNGTNVFLYPEGGSKDFPATVTIQTEPGWSVATGMRTAGVTGRYREENYHDLVDMPVFIGAIEFDSTEYDGKEYRLASYPAGVLTGEAREAFHDQIHRMAAAESRVFGETPWDSYTTMLVFDSAYPGGSALEHQNSHVGIYNPGFVGNAVLPLITGHEMFHAWNVKRLRPVQMVPYRYDRAQPTPLLWVSEGITDYYADLALVRARILPEQVFYLLTAGKINSVAGAPPVALEDASLSTWISPQDGTGTIYYEKGSLVGFMLDVLIRDATNNHASLDDVMRSLYGEAYKQGRGFTNDEFWTVVQEVSGRDLTDWYRRYVDGRDEFPWPEIVQLAGLVLDSAQVPQLGVQTTFDSSGAFVSDVTPGGAAERAGIRVGDYIVSVGDVKADAGDWGFRFRSRYQRSAEGMPIEIVVKRGSETLTLSGALAFRAQVDYSLGPSPFASAKAARIRAGILAGKTD